MYFQWLISFIFGEDESESNSWRSQLRTIIDFTHVLVILGSIFTASVIFWNSDGFLQRDTIDITTSPSRHVDVIVIGAGFSGLGVSEILHTHGVKDFVLLEAKSSLGGRVQNARWGGITVGLGAGWIAGIDDEEDPNPLWEVAQGIQFEVHHDDYDQLIYR